MIPGTSNSVIGHGLQLGKRVAALAVVVFIVAGLMVRQSIADVVIRIGEARPLVCRIEEQDSSGIVVRISDPDGTSRRVTLRRDEILLVVPAQDPAKLAELEPGSWDHYRLMAEEAAARRVDPDAAALAIRLQLIVAFHSEGAVRAGAFAALFDLARTPEEERRLRALAFRTQTNASPSLLVNPRTAPPTPLDSNDRNLLLQTVRLLRAGEGDAALAAMRQPQFPEVYSRVAQILPFQELQRYAYDRSRTQERIRDLVRLEYVLLGEAALAPLPAGSNPSQRRSDAPWHRPLDEPSDPWTDVDWTSVTEFEPRDCLFRDGTWRRP